MSREYSKISLTAKLTAFMREFTDIPFAKDVARIIGARGAFEELLCGRDLLVNDLLWYAPILEARYKSVGEMINRLHIRQVLEVAGGLTLRGLAATADPNVVYVDTDLNDLTREKSDLALDISSCHRLSARGNFHLASANALELNSLVAAVNGIFRDGEPIAVVQEGLLPYLTALETETVARNIRALLQKFGGAWITSDFTLKSDATPVTEQQRRFREIVSAATDVKMYNNAFDDAEQLDSYFGRFGFQMEVYNQLDLAPQLSSADLIPQAQLEEFKPRLRLWVLRLAG